MIGYKEMADFEYTDSWEEMVDFDSDSVEYIWYNQNTKQAAVEWMESVNLYVYDNVPLDVVLDAVNADSVGATVAKTIKQVYGPGTNLGDRYSLDLVEVDVESETKEYSLQTPSFTDATTSQSVASQTKEFSLQTPEKAVEAKSTSGGLSLTEGEPVYTLHFDYNGEDRTFSTRKADNWEDSLDRLEEFAKSVGLDIKVNKVVVTFE